MATLGLTKSEIRHAIARVLEMLGEGKTDVEIRDDLGLDQDGYDLLKRKMYEVEGDRIRGRSIEETFIDYMTDQRACVKELDDIAKAFAGNQLSAKVGAIRAKSDIVDKIVKFGQDIGLIDRRPEEKRILAGVMVADMSNKQLRGMITSELANLDKMVKTFGEGSILDMKPGQLHYDPVPALGAGAKGKTPAKSKTNKAKANKVHGGRRVVRKKATS